MTSFDERHRAAVAAEFAKRGPAAPLPPLTEADLAPLPAPVRRYVAASGALGRPRPRNMRLVFEARMYRKPGAPPMVARAFQYNWFDRPTRLFLMRARMFGLPVRALHLYREAKATFQVRVAGLVNVVDQAGAEISSAETVTVLNDMCFMAPGALVDERLAWEPLDDRSARVTLVNAPHRVSATLFFDEHDELVDFWSDDRPDSSSGRFVPCRWKTPALEHGPAGGLRLATAARADYERPEGTFTYGEFRLVSVRYDLEAPLPPEW